MGCAVSVDSTKEDGDTVPKAQTSQVTETTKSPPSNNEPGQSVGTVAPEPSQSSSSTKSPNRDSSTPNRDENPRASSSAGNPAAGKSKGEIFTNKSCNSIPSTKQDNKPTMKHSSSLEYGKKTDPGETPDNALFPTSTSVNLGERQGLKKFKYKDLAAATQNFQSSLILGEGSFGVVYRATVVSKDGESQVLALKKLNHQSTQGFDEWLAEVLLLEKLLHPHLVKLVGYCSDKGEHILAYELCDGGSLLDAFENVSKGAQALTWNERLDIAYQTGQALKYLHDNGVIHRDLKPANIMLMKDKSVRLTDFGMAKETSGGMTHVSTRVLGTMGYLDPNYMETGKLRASADVYAFGVILLEILTGKCSNTGGKSLVAWSKPYLNAAKPDTTKLVDPLLVGKFPPKAAQKLATVVKCCIANDPEKRPSTEMIVRNLKNMERTVE